MSAVVELLAELRALEEMLFENSTRRNLALVESMLTDSFREFGSSGRVYDKAMVLASLTEELPAELSGRDFELQIVCEDAALLTYVSDELQEELEPVTALRSSLWVRRGGKWKMHFHQGTRVPSLLI